MKFCVNTYLDNRTNPIAFQGQGSQDQIFGFFTIASERGQKNCQHDNSWTTALILMKFCTNMYLDKL